MAFDPRNFSFSRQILPVIAVIGLILAVFFIWNGLPDRQLSEPEREPPRAPAALANTERVAGAGVVEPSSEVIQIGSALSGLVTGLYVAPGDRVGAGQVLFQLAHATFQGGRRRTPAVLSRTVVRQHSPPGGCDGTPRCAMP